MAPLLMGIFWLKICRAVKMADTAIFISETAAQYGRCRRLAGMPPSISSNDVADMTLLQEPSPQQGFKADDSE